MALGADKVDAPQQEVADAATADAGGDLPLVVIEPKAGWQALELGELWRYRELVYFLAWRDVKVRYKQTLLGALWAILQPTLLMVVFTLVLGQRAAIRDGHDPYPLFVFAGLLPWTFFATAITNAGQSVVTSERLITKVYFPRLAIPFAAVGAALVDFAIATAMLIALLVYYRVAPGWGVVLVPGLVLLLTVAALGVGTLLAALNVAYRDVRYVIPFLVQVWLLATPSIYLAPAAAGEAPPAAVAADSQAEQVRSGLAGWLELNPMTGLVAFFRASILGGNLPWRQLAYSTAVVACLFGAGCYYFRRVEDAFADII